MQGSDFSKSAGVLEPELRANGIRLPQGFSFGAQVFGRSGYIDAGLTKSAEILRGPGSVLYGSDGFSGIGEGCTWPKPQDGKSNALLGRLVLPGRGAMTEGETIAEARHV